MPRFTSKRGMTLAEIMVALAVVAVMITLVVSFAVMLGDRVDISGARLEAQQDMDLLESGAEGWISSMTQSGAAYSADGGNLTAKIGEEEYTLSFVYSSLTGTRPDGSSLTVRTERVKSAEFQVEQNGGDALFFCTVTYEIPQAGSNVPAVETHTFCINPRVGETVTGGANEAT